MTDEPKKIALKVSGSFKIKGGEYIEEITVKVYSPITLKETCHAQADEIRNVINDYLETLVLE